MNNGINLLPAKVKGFFKQEGVWLKIMHPSAKSDGTYTMAVKEDMKFYYFHQLVRRLNGPESTDKRFKYFKFNEQFN